VLSSTADRKARHRRETREESFHVEVDRFGRSPDAGFRRCVAHDSEPELDPDPALAAMRYCQLWACARPGARKRVFLGAPAQFKYIAQAPLKRMFMGETSDIPTDAIYVLEDMDLDQRRQYEENAFFGWKQADAWMREGRERPDTKCWRRCSTTAASNP
jgi:hypothetical protein